MTKNLVIIASIILNVILIIIFLPGKDLPVSKKYILIEAEEFTDSNGNGEWDEGENFDDCGLDDNDIKICSSNKNWKDKYGNGEWDNDINVYIEDSVYNSGNIKKKQIYFNGDLVKEILFFEDNQIKEEKKYRDNEKSGMWILYGKDSNSKRYIIEESQYKEGSLIQRTRFYPNGNYEESASFDSDNISTVVKFYPNGKKQGEGKMLNKNGTEFWYDNWIWYDLDGNIVEAKSFNEDLNN